MFVRGFLLICFCLASVGCQTMGPNQQRDTAIGALTGSMVGAAIGDSRGQAAQGALVGAMAGGLTGNAVGSATDREIDRARGMQQLAFDEFRRGTLSFQQIVDLHVSGVGPEVIVRQVQTQGLLKSPTADDLIFLQSHGVSDQVLLACQSVIPLADNLPWRSASVSPEANLVYPVIAPCPPVYFAPPYRPMHRRHSGRVGVHIGF